MPVKTTNLNRPMGAAALRNVERQRQMAQALQGQAMQPLRGQMAGRVYVAPSPMQGVAKLGQMLAGTYAQNKADEREAQIQADQRQAFATDMQAYQDSIKGTPEVLGRPEIHAIPPQGIEGSETNPYQPATEYQPSIEAQAAIPGMSIQDAAMQHLNSKSDLMRKFSMDQLGKTQDPYNLAPGAKRFTGDNREVAANPKEQPSNLNAAIRNKLAVKGIIPKNATFEQKLQAQKEVLDDQLKIAKEGRPKLMHPQVKAGHEDLAKFKTSIFDQARLGNNQLNNLDRVEQLIGDYEGSGLSDFGLQISKAARAINVNIDENIDNKIAAKSLANQMAIAMRPPASGVMTDKDFAVFEQTVPSLTNTVEGRKLIVQTFRKKILRDQAIARLVYKELGINQKIHGERILTDDIYMKIQDYERQNPVFPTKENMAIALGLEKQNQENNRPSLIEPDTRKAMEEYLKENN